MKRVVVMSPAMSQPRFHRRARMLSDAGFEVQVYSFKREYFTGNSFPSGMEVVELGRVLKRDYLNRIPKMISAINKVRGVEKMTPAPPALVYAFGLDMVIISAFALPRDVPLVYETGDLQNPLPHRSLRAKAMAVVDKFAIRRADVLAATSEKFISEYFNRICPGVENKSFTIENLVSRETARIFDRPAEAKNPSLPIRIGFVGRLRYPRCLIPLMEAVKTAGNRFELHLYGMGQLLEIVKKYASENPNIHYHGKFKNPDDLGEIYESIDINFVVYDNDDANVRLALPNKLYESPYFGTPLVVASRTYLSERVSKSGLGIVVDPDSPNFAEELLDGLTPERLRELSGRTLEIPTSELVENFEGLKNRLNALAELRSGSPARN